MLAQLGASVADDDAYQRALKRKHEVLAQLQALQVELRDVEGFISLYERLFQKPEARTSAEHDGGEEDEATPRRQRNILPPAQLAGLCRDIIRERGEPMTRSELLEALSSRGITLTGSDPSKNLGTILWRNQANFINLPGRGYWLRDLPLPKP